MRKNLMTYIMIITIMVSLFGCTVKSSKSDSAPEENIQDASTTSSEINSQKEINTAEESTQDDKVELIIYDQKLSEYLSSVMRERMPDVTFSYVSEEGNTLSYESDEIVQRLLSDDDSFDIYVISSKTDFAQSLLNKGLYGDISTYPEINDVFDDMYPSFLEASTINGEIFGMPLQFYSYGHLMSPRPYMEKIGWSIEQLTTIDDLLMFDEEWRQSNQDIGSIALHKDMVLNQIVFRYIYNHYDYTKDHVDLENAEFNDVLTSAKKLYESDMIHDDYSYLGNYDYVLAGTIRPISHYSEYLQIPQIKDQNDKNGMWAYWLVINPNSDNIDSAVEMLSILAEVYKTEDINSYLYDDGEFSESVSKLYQEHQLFFAFPGESQVREILNSYLNGDMKMEEAILEAQLIIDTVSQEQSEAN